MNQEKETGALQSPRQGIFYGWWLTGIAAFVMVIGTVPIFQGMTAWFVVLEQQFGYVFCLFTLRHCWAIAGVSAAVAYATLW